MDYQDEQPPHEHGAGKRWVTHRGKKIAAICDECGPAYFQGCDHDSEVDEDLMKGDEL